MNLKPKYVLPKSQMIVNSLLSEYENEQLDFRQQQFSIQKKNNGLLKLNFYQPDLQDIQWSLQFMGVKSISHSSVSYHSRKRLRIVLWKNNSLHFMQGQTESIKNRGDLIRRIIESQKMLQLKLENKDNILFISQDLFPQYDLGAFLICTVRNRFYVLKGSDHHSQLIDFNQSGRLRSLLTSLEGFITSRNIQNQQNDKKIISYILIKLIEGDGLSFKAIILKDFNLQIRFLSIHMQPGDISKNHTQLLGQMNLQPKIMRQIQNTKQVMLISSELYELNPSEIGAIFLIKNLQITGQFIVVSIIVDFQKRQVIATNHLPINGEHVQNIQFLRIPQTQLILLKIQEKSQMLLLKISIRNLEIQQNLKYNLTGNSLLSNSFQKKKLLLLTRFRIFDINMAHQDSAYLQKSQADEILKQTGVINDNHIQQLSKYIQNHRLIIKRLMNQNRLEQVLEAISSSQNQIDLKLTPLQIKSSSNQTLRQLLKTYNQISFCHIFMSKQIQQGKQLLGTHPKNKNKIQELFITNRNNSISQLFQILVDQQKWVQFLQIWIIFLQQYRQKKFFSGHKIRNIESQILNQQSSYGFNSFMQSYFKKQNLDKNPEPQIQKLIITVVKLSSGIMKISRQNYRILIRKPLNLRILKKCALEQLNSELFYLIYFQTDEFRIKDLKLYLSSLRQDANETHVQNFVIKLFTQYIQRTKNGKMNRKPGTLSQITSFLKQNLKPISDYLKTDDNDLLILIGLKLGQRQKISQRILKVSSRTKSNHNQQKLLLTLPGKYGGQGKV